MSPSSPYLPAFGKGHSAAQLLGDVKDKLPEGKQEILQGLINALETNSDLDRWAAVDLRAVFDSEDISRSAAALWLGAALEVLVFLPICITWFGLMFASITYRETLGKAALNGESFLQRWQTGFAGALPAGLSFDHIAIYTFTSIALILLVAAAHSWFRTRQRSGDERQLDAALTAAELQLGPIRLGAPSQVAAELTKTSAQIAATADQVKKVSEAAASTQDKAKESLTVVRDTLARIETAVASVAGAVGSVEAAGKVAGETARALSAAEAEFTRRSEAAGKQLEDGLRSLSEVVRDNAAKAQHDMTAALGGASAAIAHALDTGTTEVRDALAELHATWNDYLHRLESTADILGRASETVEGIPTGIAELRERMAEVFRDASAVMGTLPDAVSGLEARLGILSDQIDFLNSQLGNGMAAGFAPGPAYTPTAGPGGDGAGGGAPRFPAGAPGGTGHRPGWLKRMFGRS